MRYVSLACFVLLTGCGSSALPVVDYADKDWQDVTEKLGEVTGHEQQAEDVVANGQADIVAIARAALDGPHWPHHAAAALHSDEDLPVQYFGASKGVWAGYREKAPA